MTDRKLVVRVQLDEDVESPMDQDGQWTLYSFSRKHKTYRDPESLGLGELEANGRPRILSLGLRRKLEVGLAHFVAYFEHGSCRWSLTNDPTRPNCRWDSVSVAGLLVWENKPEDMGARTYEDRAKDAASFLETFTSWCNEDCYYYTIEDEAGEVVGSCGGYIGPDLGYLFDDAFGELDEEQRKLPVEFPGDEQSAVHHAWEDAAKRAAEHARTRPRRPRPGAHARTGGRTT